MPVSTRLQKSFEARILALEKQCTRVANICSNLTRENQNLRKTISKLKHCTKCDSSSATDTLGAMSTEPTNALMDQHFSTPICPETNTVSKNTMDLTHSVNTQTLDLSFLQEPVTHSTKICNQTHSEPSFIEVRNPSKPVTSNTSLPIETSNPFEVLSSPELTSSANTPQGPVTGGDTPPKKRKTLIIGDSNVKRLASTVNRCCKNRDSLKVMGLGGAKIQDCEKAACQELLKVQDDKIQVVLHAGTNNVHREGSEGILDQYKNFVKNVHKAHTDVEVVICSMPDRRDRGSLTFSRVISINHRLPRLCKDISASFLPIHSRLDNLNTDPLHFDGLHYSQAGSFVAGDYLATIVDDFLG